MSPEKQEDQPTRYAAWKNEQAELEDSSGTGSVNNLARMVGLRLSPADRERFEVEAKGAGVTLSEYLRNLLHDAQERPELRFKQFLRNVASVKGSLENYLQDGVFSEASPAADALKVIGTFLENEYSTPQWVTAKAATKVTPAAVAASPLKEHFLHPLARLVTPRAEWDAQHGSQSAKSAPQKTK